MKKITDEESDTDYAVLKIVGQFNKKVFNKNQLIKNISLIENVAEVSEA